MNKKHRSAGFSLVEIVVVIVLITIIILAAFYSFIGIRRNIKTNTALARTFSLFQQARQRAITDRLPYSVVIRRGPDAANGNLINSIVISKITPTLPIADPNRVQVIRREFLPQDVTLVRPMNVMFNAASGVTDNAFEVFMTDPVTIFFNIDGSVTSGDFFPQPAAAPFSGSFFFADGGSPTVNSANPNLTRVLTLVGATAGTRTLSYLGGTTYQTGNKTY